MDSKNKSLDRVSQFLFEVGSLRKIARSHRQALLTDDISDNIASHSYRVAVIGWFLAKCESADESKVVIMCLFHDVSETRSGDQNWVHKKYVTVHEDEIIKDQFSDLPFEGELLEISDEYKKRESIESKLAKDADLLDQILLQKEYVVQGNTEALSWQKGTEHVNRMFSNTAKDLAMLAVESSVHDWWKHVWTADRRK